MESERGKTAWQIDKERANPPYEERLKYCKLYNGEETNPYGDEKYTTKEEYTRIQQMALVWGVERMSTVSKRVRDRESFEYAVCSLIEKWCPYTWEKDIEFYKRL